MTRETIEVAPLAEAFAFDPDSLMLLSAQAEGDGWVYKGQRPESEAVLKVASVMETGGGEAGDDEAAARVRAARMAFMRYLGDHGASIARPLPSRDGEWIVAREIEGRPLTASAFERAHGTHLGRRMAGQSLGSWNEALYAEWGRVMGRIHALGRDFARQPIATDLPTWEGEVDHFIATCRDAAVRVKWDEMRRFLDSLPRTDDGFGPIHNDLHPQNFLVGFDRGKLALTVIDFDVCNHHWFMTGIALALYHAMWAGGWQIDQSPFVRQFVPAFMAGYREENPLASEWGEHLQAFLRYRELLMFTVFSDVWRGSGGWQRGQLRMWRDRILSGRSIVNVTFG